MGTELDYRGVPELACELQDEGIKLYVPVDFRAHPPSGLTIPPFADGHPIHYVVVLTTDDSQPDDVNRHESTGWADDCHVIREKALGIHVQQRGERWVESGAGILNEFALSW